MSWSRSALETLARWSAIGLLVGGCASGSSVSRTPDEVFETMERVVLGEDHISFTVESHGVFESNFEGWITRENGELAMSAQGVWGGEPVSVSAETTRDLLVINTPTRMERVRREPFVSRAVSIGLTRMGVLHNLARLVAGKEPDHSDGSVRDWVRAENIEFVDGDPDRIRFDIVVDGSRAGDVVVTVDPASGRPLRREQTVEFVEGTMTVVEIYGY